ncbi:hypothetical protein ABZZ79_30155 [Streptomyces sp. NPDC006458]|uniref:hypothetical protein n=1 Tax=Streptomyces sp. NPDC006458 TaxID=3154302 RepID=UPI0033A294F2
MYDPVALAADDRRQGSAEKVRPLPQDLIRRTIRTVLGKLRLGRPDLGSEEQHAHLAGLLRGQMHLLLRDLDRADGMSRKTCETADWVAGRAREALYAPLAGVWQPDRLHDLAVWSRALLILLEQQAAQHAAAPPLRPRPRE